MLQKLLICFLPIFNFFLQEIEERSINSEKTECEDSLVQPYNELKQDLEIIKAELDLSFSCWEEANVRLENKYNKEEKKIEKLQSINQNTEENINPHNITSSNTNKAVKVIGTKESIIEDEVFEAYIDEEFSLQNNEDSEQDWNDDFWTSDPKEERKKIKSQKEQGKRVLNELKPILSKRRVMWEEREEKALFRMNLEVIV